MTTRVLKAAATWLGLLGCLRACERTGEGEYEVQRPVFGTTTDTIRVPTLEVNKDTHVIVTPDIDVNRTADTARDTTKR